MMTVSRNHLSGSHSANRMEPEELISYRESLTDLKANSKPHINMLTMLAEESFQQGSAVVRVIEDHILQVIPKYKLPSLYLIDSIMKNVTQGDFKPLFRPRLIAIVSHIFSQSDEVQRKSIFKLRHTWTGLFEDGYLAQLDRAIHSIDENWPIVATSPPEGVPPVLPASRAPVVNQVGGGMLRLPSETLRVPSPVAPPMETDLSSQDLPVLDSIKNIPSPGPPIQKPKKKSKAFAPVVQKTEVPAKVSGVSVRVESLKPPRPTELHLTNSSLIKKEEPKSNSEQASPALQAEKPKEKADTPPEAKADKKQPDPPKRPLGRIPKKAGTPVVPRGRGRVLGSLVSDRLKPAVLKAPKRPLELQGPEKAENARLKFQKVNFRPDEDMEPPSRPVPAAVPQQRFVNTERHSRPLLHRPPVQNRMRGMDNPRHSFTRQNAHRPYDAPPRRAMEMERPAWMGPDRGPPLMDRYGPRSPQNNMYMGNNNRPRSPLIAAPPVERRPTPKELCDFGKSEAREKLERGEINSMTYQQTVDKLEKDREMNELRAVVEQSAMGIPVDAQKDPSTAFIDQQARVVRWVKDVGPVVVIDGLIFDIGFNHNSPAVNVYIDHIATSLRMDKESSLFFGNKFHSIKFGGPNSELVIDGIPYRINFAEPAETPLFIDGQYHRVRLGGPPPQVCIGSQPLNDRIFGNPSTLATEDPLSSDDLIQRILASPAFASLVAPAVAAPPAVEARRLPEPDLTQPPSVVPPLPGRLLTGENGLDWSKTTDRQKAKKPEPFDPETFIRMEIRAPDWAGSDWKLHEEEENFRTFEKGKEPEKGRKIDEIVHSLYLPFLLKLRLRPCEAGPWPEERPFRALEIKYHNEWVVKKEMVNTADWHIEAEEFLEERSFDCDMTVSDRNKMFTDYIVKYRPSKAALMAVEEESSTESPAPADKTETADFRIVYNPVAPSSQKNHCEICLEDIAVELNEDDDEWILKDGVEVTSKADESVHIYHKDCYEQNKNKPVQAEENGPTLVKPARWGTSVIETPTRIVNKSEPGAWSFNTNSVPTSLIASPQVETKTDDVHSELLPPVESVVEEDSFVIPMGDDDQYEDDDLIINTQDDEEE